MNGQHDFLKRLVRLGSIAGALFLLASVGLEAKKPVLRNSKWVCEEKQFVADVGTATEITSLEFGAGNEVGIRMVWSMPGHPATYVNPDGSVDYIEGHRSEHLSRGTWRYRSGRLTITLEDGSHEFYRYKDGAFVQQTPYDTEKVFQRQLP